MSAEIISFRKGDRSTVDSGPIGKRFVQFTRLRGYVAIQIHYKMAFVDWLNGFRKHNEEAHTFVSANEHGIVVIMESDGKEREKVLSDEMKGELFEFILRHWTRDSKVWIEERSFRTFNDYFDCEVSSTVLELP